MKIKRSIKCTINREELHEYLDWSKLDFNLPEWAKVITSVALTEGFVQIIVEYTEMDDINQKG